MHIKSKIVFRTEAIIFILVCYAFLITLISMQHELWRDEVRALSIVVTSHSFCELFQNINNEGHPILWYVILYFGYNLTGNPEIIRIIHILIAVISLFVFLKYAPFPKSITILYIFGFYVLYEYAVINRNYNLSLLFIYLYCLLYPYKFKYIYLTSFILVLLANSNAHSTIISVIFLIDLIVEFINNRRSDGNKSYIPFILSTGIIVIGIAFSVWTIIPDNSTIVTTFYSFDFNNMLKNTLKAFLIPGESYHSLFGINNFYISTLIIWLFLILFIKKINVFRTLVFSVFSLSLFFNLIYPVTGPRHEGFLFILIIASFWIESFSPNKTIFNNEYFEKLSSYLYNKKYVFLIVFLLIQIINAIPAIKMDLSQEFSSSKSLGEFLEKSTTYKNSIILCEPDYIIESLPFYANNKIYFVREQKFGLKVNFTNKSKKKLKLSEFLDQAVQIKNKLNQEVLILIGYDLTSLGPFVIDAGYSRKFEYSEKQLENFINKTKKVTVFNAAFTDENYEVFALK